MLESGGVETHATLRVSCTILYCKNLPSKFAYFLCSSRMIKFNENKAKINNFEKF